jgi:hypothetical protein
MRPIPALLALCAALSSALGAAPTAGAAGNPALADCVSHSRLTRNYTIAQLENALNTMPSDVKQYTDCYDVLTRALLAQVHPHHATTMTGSSGSSGSFLPTPVLIVLIALVLGAAAFGVLALRRRARAP